MPTNKGVYHKCHMCSYSGRSDHVKTHVRTVHADGAEGWVAKPKNPSVFINSKMSTALCVNCGTSIKGDKDYCYLTLARLHSCKPKQERAPRAVPVLAPRVAAPVPTPVPTPTEAPALGLDPASLWEKCKVKLNKLPFPAKKRKTLNSIIKNNEEMFLEDEPDFEKLFINVMLDLADGVEQAVSDDD